MVFWNSQSGFTFISMLIALTMLTLSLPFVTYALSAIQSNQTYKESISIQQFFIYMQKDMIAAKRAHVAYNRLYLYYEEGSWERQSQYSLYGGTIRRQVDGTGHEIYLRNVSAVTFEKYPHSILFTITGKSGATYEKSVSIYP